MRALHAKLDKWGADVSVSLHFNAAGDSRVNGHEVLYCSKSGKKLAKKLNDLFSANLPNRDRGIKKKTRQDRGGGFLCQGRSVCVLSEPFFAAEQEYFVGPGYEELMASFLEFFDEL
jgi:N-acetylmuramoyl-L-alanine amidase